MPTKTPETRPGRPGMRPDTGEQRPGNGGGSGGGNGGSTLTSRETRPRPGVLRTSEREPLPLIAVTMGDPAGIGPEVVVKAIHQGECLKDCRPVVIGGRELMEEACRRFANGPMRVRSISIEDAPREFEPSVLYLVEALGADLKRVVPGSHSATTGRSAAAAVRLAVKLAVDGKVRGITTAPISKEAFLEMGLAFAGHTEFLADICGAKRSSPMFLSTRLRVTLVTTHLPISKVARAVTRTRIADAVELTQLAMQKFFARRRPRLAVAGLNPHCGESGHLGTEERDRIIPAIEACKQRGIDVSGPYSGDTVFERAVNEEFDVVIAMYHDQGVAPVRALGRGKVVNLSLGIPFIRTSVEHGTAPDIAWKGVASPDSMTAALRTAGRMAGRLAPGPIDWTYTPPAPPAPPAPPPAPGARRT
jgi:4-hydroxythreonine-4-phosphate dehydrogenase